MSNKQIPEEDQEFIDRQLARIREKLIQGETTRLIRGVLNWHRTDLRMSSAKYFVESGTVSGALHEAIAKIVRNYFDFAVEQPLLNKYKNEIIESRKDLHPPQQGSADIVYVPVSDTPNVHKDAFWCEEVGEWLKPQPSGEAAAVEFAEWRDKAIENDEVWYWDSGLKLRYTTEQLYTLFLTIKNKGK